MKKNKLIFFLCLLVCLGACKSTYVPPPRQKTTTWKEADATLQNIQYELKLSKEQLLNSKVSIDQTIDILGKHAFGKYDGKHLIFVDGLKISAGSVGWIRKVEYNDSGQLSTLMVHFLDSSQKIRPNLLPYPRLKWYWSKKRKRRIQEHWQQEDQKRKEKADSLEQIRIESAPKLKFQLIESGEYQVSVVTKQELPQSILKTLKYEDANGLPLSYNQYYYIQNYASKNGGVVEISSGVTVKLSKIRYRWIETKKVIKTGW